MKGKKGQQIMYGVMVGVILFIVATILISPIKDMAVSARSNLDCENTSISVGTKGVCILVDWNTFYFIGTLFVMSVGYIAYRRYRISQGG